jgi:hypothetical protein
MIARLCLLALLVEMAATCRGAAAALVITGRTAVSRRSAVDTREHRIAIRGDLERIESGDRVLLIDAARGEVTVLNPATRTYTVSELPSRTPGVQRRHNPHP